MPRQKMKRHLRTNKKSEEKKEQFWYKLHSKALRKAQSSGEEEVEKKLDAYSDDPETILRRLSIISEADLEREFGDE